MGRARILYRLMITLVAAGLALGMGRVAVARVASAPVASAAVAVSNAPISNATVPLQLPPEVVGIQGMTVTVPLTIPVDVTGLAIIAYQFTLEFDADQVQLQGVRHAGTLSGGWDVVYNPNVTGELRVAAYGVMPLVNSGTLLNLVFVVVGEVGASSALTLVDARFNEGSPTMDAQNGVVRVGANPTAAGGGPYAVDEGASVVLAGSGVDPGGLLGPLRYAWDLDNDGSFERAGQTPIFDAVGVDGPDTMTVRLRVTNRAGGTATTSAVIMVRNVAPVALDDQLAAREDDEMRVAAPGVLANDQDAVDTLGVTRFAAVSEQGATVSVGAGGNVRYDPRAAASLQALGEGVTVTDRFTYTTGDGDGGQATATVKVAVTGANDAPRLANQAFQVAEDRAVGTVVGTLDASDVDAGEALTFAIVGGNAHRRFALDAESGLLTVAGALDFECAAGYALTVQVTDAHGARAEAVVTVAVDDLVDDESACEVIAPTGGAVTLVMGSLTIEARFPPDALTAPATFALEEGMAHPISPTHKAIGLPFVIRAVGEDGVSVPELAASFTLTISVGNAFGEFDGTRRLLLYRWDDQAERYIEIEATLLQQPQQLVAVVDELGEYALFEHRVSVPTPPQLFLPAVVVEG